MAGTKRRRGGSPRKAAPKKSTAMPPTQQNAVNRLISQLFKLRKESPNAVERLWGDETSIKFLSENFQTSRISQTIDEIQPDDAIGYYLLLAAQTLESLALNPSDNAVSMAWLAFAVAPLSIPPQSDFLSTKAARHVAGRALLASTFAARQALEHLTGDNKRKKSNHKSAAMAILAAILALDNMAGLSLEAEDVTSTQGSTRQVRQIWKVTRAALQLHAENYWFDEGQNEIDTSGVWNEKLEACWRRICGVEQEDTSSTAASVTDLFAQAIDQYYLITDHSNVSSRWVATALTMSGEPRWLETNVALLGGPWIEHWSCPVIDKTEDKKTPPASSTSELSGSVVSIVLVSRMLQLLREVSKSIDRKFNSHLGIYTTSCWPSNSTAKKQDPRDIGAVLLYDILAVHRRCLQEIELPIVNDDDTIEDKEALCSYYPFVNDILEHLSLSVSSSPSLSLSYESQIQVKNRLEGLATAFIFQQHQSASVIDARLIQYALLQLVRALSQSCSTYESGSWLTKKANMVPLAAPSLSAKTKEQRKGNKTRSTFAGIFPGDYGPSHRGDAKLALTLRAVSSSGSWDTRCSVLLTFLLDLIASLYDTTKLEYPTTYTRKASGSPVGTEIRLSRSQSRSGRGGKRQKLEKADSEHLTTNQSSPRFRLSETRASVCSNALDALSLCLRFPHDDQNLSQLQKLFRPNLKSDHVLKMLRLESALCTVLPSSDVNDMLGEKDGGLTSLDFFTDGEKKVWSSHMNACVTLGRGQVSYRSGDKHVYLGPRRMEILEEISSASSMGGKLSWPLHLPPSHRIIVASNLASEEIQSACLDAERFIVDGALVSIREALEYFPSWPFRDPGAEISFMASAYDKVLLSLDDARLILAAFCRLDQVSREEFFAELMYVVRPWIESIFERPNDITRLKVDFEASGFVSRVIAFCANAYSLLRFGPAVRGELMDLVGSSHTSFVLFARRSPQYCAEKSFRGVLGNWEFSDDSSVRFSLQDVDPRVEESLKHVLESAFRLGFLTGPVDQGHLIFSAWNGLGKTDLWSLRNEVTPIPRNFVLGESNASSMILELRDDLCLVNRLMRKFNCKASSASSLITVADSRAKHAFRSKGERPLKIGECLLAMVNKASTLVQTFLDTYDSQTLSAIPLQVQCLLHVLSTYVCFAASSCTRPKVDFFSSLSSVSHGNALKRKRGDSTESEATVSDGDASEAETDAALDSLKRIEEVCAKIGASPAYPDWLDVECSLLDRVNLDMALDIAQKAQKCLLSLAVVSICQIKARQHLAFTKQSLVSAPIASSIVELCWVDHFWDTALCDLLSRHLKVEPENLRFVTESLTTDICNRQALQWFKSSAQRVQGNVSELFRSSHFDNIDVSVPVLRATGEWEMLMARGLTSACLGLDSVSSASTNASQPFLEALRWLSVMRGAIDCFVPVVALIHFGLRQGGRHVHPLRSFETGIDDVVRYEYLQRSFFDDDKASASLKESLQETLALLSIAPSTSSLGASAAHLCSNKDTFPRLRRFASIKGALNILVELHELSMTEDHNKEELFRMIVDGLALIVEKAKNTEESSAYQSPSDFLLSALSASALSHTKTILNVEFDTAFVARILQRTSFTPRGYERSSVEDEKIRGLSCLTSFIWTDCKLASHASRLFFVGILYEVINTLPEEGEGGLMLTFFGLIGDCDDDALRRLMVEDICFGAESGDDIEASRKLQECLCSLFSVVLRKGSDVSRFKKSGVIVKSLLESIQMWREEPWFVRVRILNLLLLHSTVVSELHWVGQTLLSFYKETERPPSVDVENLCHLFNFVSWLRSSLAEKETNTRNGGLNNLRALLPPVCTYVAFSDFHEQHWYQCFTCGLTGDRGCCSLCALVCHRGHDVVYARKSSFFCDCGAEQTGSGITARSKCKCLQAVPQSKVDSILMEEKAANFASSSKMNESESPDMSAYTKCISSSYGNESRDAVSLFLKDSGFSERSNVLLVGLANEFKSELSFSRSACLQDGFDRQLDSRWTYSALRTALHDRECTLSMNGPISFFQPHCISFFAAGSLHVMLSSLKRAYLSENRVERQVMQADTRGRIFIGEANSVLICNGFAVCSFPFLQSKEVSVFSRQSLGILKSVHVHFEVIGLKLAPGNERITAVWGSHDISILVMNRALNDCEQRFSLSMNSERASSSPDSILKCQWLSGSARYLVASCRTMLLFYDIESSDRSPVARLSSPAIVDGDILLEIDDFLSVPIRSEAGSAISWKLYVLLKDGTVHSARIICQTDIVALSSTQIPKGQGLRIASNALSGGPLGKACCISFLTQSSTLIYQESGSYAYGLLINRDGEIDHCFPILPQRLSVKESGINIEIKGPYTHWCELGLIRDESISEPFFRVTCMGREVSSDLQVLVSVDFNKLKTTIKVAKLVRKCDSSVSFAFENVIGCTTVSCPLEELSTTSKRLHPPKRLEQAFVCLLTEKGSVISFADDCTTPLMLSIDPVLDKKGNVENPQDILNETDIPLLFFEKLTNVNEYGHVFYHGGVMESPEETKTKLLRENDGFVRSPEINGFTLNISTEAFIDHKESLRGGIVIAAVRLLVGSTEIESIPQYICVQGNRIDMVPGEKRWYAVHLTMQGVIAGMRSGVISVFISKTFGGISKAIIDGLELHGIERSTIESWVPTSVKSLVASHHPTFPGADHLGGTMAKSERLRLILSGLSNFAHTFNCPCSMVFDKALLSDVIAESFLRGDVGMLGDMTHLVASAGLLENDRQGLVDDALISAGANLLEKYRNCFEEKRHVDTEARWNLWHTFRPIMRAYFRAVAVVARLRPKNYLKSARNYSESIAVKISKLMGEEFLSSPNNADAVSDFVELSLLECAVARGFGGDFDSREKFAGFDVLVPLFSSTNRLIVESASLAVLNFCKKYSTKEELLGDESDLFAAQSMAVYYGCDFCGCVPIKEVRYTFEDEDHLLDLCRMCYSSAHDYAKSHNFSESEEVIPGGTPKGDGPKLTCAEVRRLKPQTVDVSLDSTNDDSADLDASANAIGEVRAQVFQRRQLFGDFIDGLVSMIGNLIASEIEKHELLVSPLISLIDDLSRLNEQNSKPDRAIWLARKLVEGLSRMLQRLLPTPLPDNELPPLSVACLQRFALALSSLVVPDKEAREFLINPSSDSESTCKLDKETTHFKCNHGMAAVRRKLEQGPSSGRSFYSCGVKSKAHRCNYFEWTDDSSMYRRPQFNENAARKIWEMMSKPQSERRVSIQEMLCYFLKKLLSTVEDGPRNLSKVASESTYQVSCSEILSDFKDGSLCSRGRIRDSLERPVSSQSVNEHQHQSLSTSVTQTRSILELLALIADGGNGELWFDPLCRILLSPHENTSTFRPLAKRCLFHLCGKSPALFLDVRDSYLFKNRFEVLLTSCKELVEYCLIVNEKALKQKTRGQDGHRLAWEKLSLREIIGATDLMSEDASLRDCSSKVSTTLEELLLNASKRPKNWKAFCLAKKSGSSLIQSSKSYPLFDVLALPSLLVGDNRVKSMKLASLAFVTMSSPVDPHETSTRTLETGETNEQTNCGITEDDIFAFVVRFVCSDESQDVRRLGMIVARGLCDEGQMAAKLFVRLMRREASMIGSMGKLFVEFFTLLNTLLQATSKEFIDVSLMLATVESVFREQTLANCCSQLEGEGVSFETKKNSAIQRTRFDLAPCAHIISRPPPNTKAKRHSEQVGPYARFRLKVGSEAASSNEFNHFLSLPHRCVISEIHVEISDPRGRFVKTINFYYSPRPINSPPSLKEAEYLPFWKRCGRVTLERAAEKISYQLNDPIVASNLRIEFDEFYERPGSQKSDDFVVYCPRCMRVVTNAHGVCGSCGEVAFQCRKCRHINYDRLNAYLCVECGYCASAGLSYELTAAVATNAVAITCDNDYQEALSLYYSASKISEDLRAALEKSLKALLNDQQQDQIREPVALVSVFDSTSVARAFDGQLPLKPGPMESVSESSLSSLNLFNKRGSVVKAIALKRKDPVDAFDTSRPQQPIARHSNVLDREDFDDASDFFGGLLENSGMGRGLDRLLASVQRQRERNSGRDGAERSSQQHQCSSTSGVDECSRLYRLIHEAQRECFRLERRIEAWQRLEAGSLTYDDGDSSPVFQPSRCSVCSPLITRQLLMLWHSVFLLDPGTAQINEDMLAILLAEDAMSAKCVQEIKQEIVKDIAIKSKKGRSTILETLTHRVIDRHCAEIIASILKEETDAEIVNPFLSLADHVLDSGLAL